MPSSEGRTYLKSGRAHPGLEFFGEEIVLDLVPQHVPSGTLEPGKYFEALRVRKPRRDPVAHLIGLGGMPPPRATNHRRDAQRGSRMPNPAPRAHHEQFMLATKPITHAELHFVPHGMCLIREPPRV